MKKIKFTHSLTFLFFLALVFSFSCKTEKKDPETEALTNLMLLTAISNGGTCPTCSCMRTDDCIDFDASAWNQSRATSACRDYALGTFSSTSSCSSTKSQIGVGTGTYTATKIGSGAAKITFYDFYTSTGSTDFATTSDATITVTSGGTATVTGAQSKTINQLGKASTFVASSTKPRIKIVNASGSTENYTLHSSAACGAGTLVKTFGSTTNGASLGYFTVDAGKYAISFNAGTNCSALNYTFSNGNVWTITSGTSAYTIAATTE